MDGSLGFNTFEKQDKILVGMSGGVDSSVTVRILQEQGFAVQGAVIRFSEAHDAAVQQAKAAADSLGIVLHTIDASELFTSEVIRPFCASYCSGRTPNPCILCNPLVKFRLLAEKADELDCRFIATGHYARIEQCPDGVYRLCCPESAARDQTYMLYRLPQKILQRLVLPLGEFEKDDVREIARDIGLSCAEAPDSMEICFIPDGDYSAYIHKQGFQPAQGRFIGPNGEDFGPHAGVDHYTIGQRKGLGIAAGRPLFVKEILPNGDVRLAESGGEYSSRMTLSGIVTPDGRPLPDGEYRVKVRSAAQAVRCRFVGGAADSGRGVVTFPDPVRAPAPGQSAVFYRGGFVFGGGFIETTE
ncbi:MAG: tRNA 2-thiouridine(34) synthase MnmA [Gemmiger sp.]|uniref:tRNA 2-thiouridine(34) synthase MnmA n=1 Tax=Gemmiger sp. TaxID=2049027 RepID=UPI002E75A14B|nr:tRNA 2-thiouridine(34) synthase MnmA [Gemmiger sp.]MEE0801715.1 tRNA 2-thiouridine(34) synthase MnmA [Gemmiger sp.]